MNDFVKVNNGKLTISLGPTWSGFEFITIQRYKCKAGYKISFVRRYWSGKYRTLKTTQAQTAEEIVQKIHESLLPIFRLPDDVIEQIKQFCREGVRECTLFPFFYARTKFARRKLSWLRKKGWRTLADIVGYDRRWSL